MAARDGVPELLEGAGFDEGLIIDQRPGGFGGGQGPEVFGALGRERIELGRQGFRRKDGEQ